MRRDCESHRAQTMLHFQAICNKPSQIKTSLQGRGSLSGVSSYCKMYTTNISYHSCLFFHV